MNNLKGSLARAYANTVVKGTGKTVLRTLAKTALPIAFVISGALGVWKVKNARKKKTQSGGMTSNMHNQAIRNAENMMRKAVFTNKMRRHGSKALDVF